MKLINWFKKAFEAVSVWFKVRGLKNSGWLIAFVVLFIKTGFPAIPLLAAAGLVFLGIFIEKNRKSLVEIFNSLKGKVEDAIENN